MIKQVILLIAMSVAVVFCMSYAQVGVQWLVNAHHWISQILTDVFSGGQAGNLIRGFLALLAIPVVVGLIPAIAYYMLRRHWFPFFMEIVWAVWLLQAGALIMVSKAAG